MKILKKKKNRIKRALKTRTKIKKQKTNRLLINKSNMHIYAQITNPTGSKTLLTVSSLEKKIKSKNNKNQKTACLIGKIIAIRAIKKKIKVVTFDRSGFKYHGHVKSIAESARKNGLKF